MHKEENVTNGQERKPITERKEWTELEIAWMILNLWFYLFLFWIFTTISDLSMRIIAQIRDVNSFGEWNFYLLRVLSKVIIPVFLWWLLWMLFSDRFKKILNRNFNIWYRFFIFLISLFLIIFIYLKCLK